MKNRLPNNLNISIADVHAEALIMGMDDIMISGGSACKTMGIKTSHVIKALGVKYPKCAIRFGLGRWTTEDDIDYASKKIIKLAKIIRGKNEKTS